MMEIDVLVDLFFKDFPLRERVEKIASCGYRFVETWGGGDAGDLRETAAAGEGCDVSLVSIVVNGPSDAGVAPINRECKNAFLERVDCYTDNALAADCRAGIVTTGPAVAGRNHQEQRKALVEALTAAGETAAAKGFLLNLEVLNTEVDHPGYFLDDPEIGIGIVKEVGSPSVKLLYDVYHMEIMRGNQTVFIESNIEWIGHFHCAGVPGRHEPFTGETNYPFLLSRIRDAGYSGYFGLEYMPELTSEESLRESLEYLS